MSVSDQQGPQAIPKRWRVKPLPQRLDLLGAGSRPSASKALGAHDQDDKLQTLQSTQVQRGVLLDAVATLRVLNERPSHWWDIGQMAVWVGSFRSEFVWDILHLLSLTKGIDKCSKFTQYTAKLVKYVCFNSVLLNRWSWQMCQLASDRARKIERITSTTRKTMRLLKCIKEVRSIMKILHGRKKHSLLDSALNMAAYLSSFSYYMLDHVLWTSNVRILRLAKDTRSSLRKQRNLASVARLVFRLLYTALSPYLLRRKERQLWDELEAAIAKAGHVSNFGDALAIRMEVLRIGNALRLLHAQKYALVLDMAECYTNFMILGKALKWFPLPTWMVSLAGMVNGMLGLHKLWLLVYGYDDHLHPHNEQAVKLMAASPAVQQLDTRDLAASAASALLPSPRIEMSPSLYGDSPLNSSAPNSARGVVFLSPATTHRLRSDSKVDTSVGSMPSPLLLHTEPQSTARAVDTETETDDDEDRRPSTILGAALGAVSPSPSPRDSVEELAAAGRCVSLPHSAIAVTRRGYRRRGLSRANSVVLARLVESNEIQLAVHLDMNSAASTSTSTATSSEPRPDEISDHIEDQT